MTKKSKGEQTKATVKVKEKSDIVVQKHGIVYKVEELNRKVTKEYNDTIKRAGSVYTANFKLIDDTIEEIKKASRKVSTNDYSANNVYLFLQDALKRVLKAEK
jgi:hypothetical protein